MSSRLLRTFITHGIASVACVAIPILVTVVFPVTTIELQRGDGVSATVTRYALLFVPYRTEYIPQVTGVVTDVMTVSYRGVDVSEVQIIISHGDEKAMIQSATGLSEVTTRQVWEYLFHSGNAPPQKMVYASSWSTYVLGGVMAGLCALYVVYVALALLTYPFKLLKSATAVPPEGNNH